MDLARKTTKRPPPVRGTGGAGFDFEDRVSAWLMATALCGQPAPLIGGRATKFSAQTAASGWHLDDLLLTTEVDGCERQLAMSVKGNVQVTSSGLPEDFVKRAWAQWDEMNGPFRRECDGLALVTASPQRSFEEPWREVKNASSGADRVSAIQRVVTNAKQEKVFNSVRRPKGQTARNDEDAMRLISRVGVLSLDFSEAHSTKQDDIVGQLRQLLVAGSADEAMRLWNWLRQLAAHVRTTTGSILLSEIWARLRTEFALLAHPDYRGDWRTLDSLTEDTRKRVQTCMPSGLSLDREGIARQLVDALNTHGAVFVHGESGVGKSALVKSTLDRCFPSLRQVWLTSEDFLTASLAAKRRSLGLQHDFVEVLNHVAENAGVLVLDAGEDLANSPYLAELCTALTTMSGTPWRLVVTTQAHLGHQLRAGLESALIEVSVLDGGEVKSVLRDSPSLTWLASHQATVEALRNPRVLAWVTRAGADHNVGAEPLVDHTAVADRLWAHWTEDRSDFQALLMRLGAREAKFERTFPLTSFDPAETALLNDILRRSRCPLRKNARNRVQFEHDLAGDWARYQHLKQYVGFPALWNDVANPLWSNSFRMLGQWLLREPGTTSASAWSEVFEDAQQHSLANAGDLLLDALCLDPDAEKFLHQHAELFLSDGCRLLNRLLRRFLHINTSPSISARGVSADLSLFLEANTRRPIHGRWPPVLRFLIAHRAALQDCISEALASVIHAWLVGTPDASTSGERFPHRGELAEMALDMARAIQVQKGSGCIYLDDPYQLTTAPLAAVPDLPDEATGWALEMAGRKDIDEQVILRIAQTRAARRQEEERRANASATYRDALERRRSPPAMPIWSPRRLPPWQLGAKRKVEISFRRACLQHNGLVPMMRTRPDKAAEVLLALLIEDEPQEMQDRRPYGVDLGLEHSELAYPVGYWKSPFFAFLRSSPVVAIEAVVKLVGFCTERWIAARGEAAGLRIGSAEQMRVFHGTYEVFSWPQRGSYGDGHLACAIEALEHWLVGELEAGREVIPYVERLLRESSSAAVVGVLVNVGKYRPALFKTALFPLLYDLNVVWWDQARARQAEQTFDIYGWSQSGQEVADAARRWALAPHRLRTLDEVLEELVATDEGFAPQMAEVCRLWPAPQDAGDLLDFKILCARLDRNNHDLNVAKGGGKSFRCPDELRISVVEWNTRLTQAIEPARMQLWCRQRLSQQIELSGAEAEHLHDILSPALPGSPSHSFEMVTVAAALLNLGGAWLADKDIVRDGLVDFLRNALDVHASCKDGASDFDVESLAQALAHEWATGVSTSVKDSDVLCLLTLESRRVSEVVMKVAHRHYSALGDAWRRLLDVMTLWSGLSMLRPGFGSPRGVVAWPRWRARLRSLPIRASVSSGCDVDMVRVSRAVGRLRLRRHATRNPDAAAARLEGLDGSILESTYGWLLDDQATLAWAVELRHVLRLWEYEVARGSAHAPLTQEGDSSEPQSQLAYKLAQKLGALTTQAPNGLAIQAWMPVLVLGPSAHNLVRHFMRTLLYYLAASPNAGNGAGAWRAIIEFGLGASWHREKNGFRAESLLCDCLGLGQETASPPLEADLAAQVADLYGRWVNAHLASDESNVERLSDFLASPTGTTMRMQGLVWIHQHGLYGRRDRTLNALVSLLDVALRNEAELVAGSAATRNAAIAISGFLAGSQLPAALVLQERLTSVLRGN